MVEVNSMTKTERIYLEIAWLCSENSESSLVARSEVIGRNVARNTRKTSRLSQAVKELGGNVDELEFMPESPRRENTEKGETR